MSGTTAARRLRGAAASPEAEAFYGNLKGFLDTRDKLNKAAPGFMPTNGAAAFDDVGGSKILRQDLGGTAADMDAQLAALYLRAPAAKEALDDFCKRLVTDAGLDPDQEMRREARDDGREDKVFHVYSAGPLKGLVRATEKAKNEYDGDAARLVDLVRGSIVCGDEASLVAVLKRVFEDFSDEAGEVCVFRSKNRFKKPTFNGYRDVLINLRLRLPDGTSMVVELQVHLVQILQFKAESHINYEYFRTYFSGNLDVVAERMKVFESINVDGIASLLDAVNSALSSPVESVLEVWDDILEKLAAYDLLAVVRECRRDMALTAHGEDSIKYSFALNSVASVLQEQGKLAAAEPLFRRALEIVEKQLGLDHPSVANPLNNIALLLKTQGKLDAAEPLYRRALEIQEKQLGRDHPNVAIPLNNLASLLQAQGKLDAAEPLFRRALEMEEKQLGPNHPSVAISLGNLADLLQAQGKLDAAEPLFRRGLEIQEKQLGRDHPNVATSLNNIASLLQDQGKLDAAEPLYRRGLEINEKQLGRDHPNVATSLNNLALLLKTQGKLDAAEPLFRRALAIQEKQLGPNHPNVATSLNNLALLLQAQGKLDAAEPLYRRALEIREKQLGPNHPNVATSLNNLASLLQAQGKLDAAEPLYRRALEIREKQLGPNHPNVATSLNNLALLLWRLGLFDAALPLQERATSICERRGDAKNEAEYRGELDKMRSGAKYPYKT